MTDASPRARRLRGWSGVLLAVCLAVVFLVPLPYEPHHRLLFTLLSNASHLPILAATTAALYYLGFARRRLLWIALAACAMAVLVEVVQPLVGRTAGWRDLLSGGLGVAIAVAAVVVWRPGRHPALRWAHGLVACALLLVVLAPAWTEWRTIRWRERAFPVLADFEEAADLLPWEIRGGTREAPSSIARTDEFATSGRMGLRVSLGAGQRAGLRYAAGSMNWEPYTTLRFDIFNPGTAFRLGLLIDDWGDEEGPRQAYVRGFVLKPGLNEFRLPMSEIREGPRPHKLDLTTITRLSLFPRIGEPPRVYFLDNMRLEMGPRSGEPAGL